MKTDSAEDEEVMRKIDALMKDPEKWKEYVASRAERAIRYWPKRSAHETTPPGQGPP